MRTTTLLVLAAIAASFATGCRHYYRGRYYSPAATYVQPQPVYYQAQPQPVYVQQPQPVYVQQPQPVYVQQPQPVQGGVRVYVGP